MCKIQGHMVKCEGQNAGHWQMSAQYLLNLYLKVAKMVNTCSWP